MCYSFRSSVTAFSLAMATVFLMYLRQSKIDKFIAPLIFTYGFVQLAEALMWYDEKCGNINKIGTYIAYYSLVFQVLALGFGVYLTEKKLFGMFIGILFFVYYFMTMPKMRCSKPVKTNGFPNMHWGFNYQSHRAFFRYIYWSALLITLFSSIKNIYKVIIIFWFSLSFSYFYIKQYGIKNFFRRYYDILEGNIGTKWCHFASVSAPGLYLIQYFIK